MSDSFRTSRSDGRSDARVVLDLASSAPPSTVFSYTQLTAALAQGLPVGTPISRQRVGSAVRRANSALLNQHQRVLNVVMNSGYRVAMAVEHRTLAVRREVSADRQLRKGLLLLKNVHFEEMDDANRNAHMAHLQISQALYSQMRGFAQRQARQDEAIATATRRIDNLEKQLGQG